MKNKLNLTVCRGRQYQTPATIVVNIHHSSIICTSDHSVSATISGYEAAGSGGFSQTQNVKANSVNWKDDWSE